MDENNLCTINSVESTSAEVGIIDENKLSFNRQKFFDAKYIDTAIESEFFDSSSTLLLSSFNEDDYFVNVSK